MRCVKSLTHNSRQRKRHLKCDEAKPSCARCVLAQWPCEYVEPGPIVRRKRNSRCIPGAASLSIHRPSTLVFCNSDERTNFGHFHCAATSNAAALFVGETWWNLALRTSVYEPAVTYAVESLGSLMDAWAVQYHSHPTVPTWAVARYNDSIAIFNKGLLYPSQQERTTIVLCLLFVTFELLCNNVDLALHHLRGGLRIAAVLRSESTNVDNVDACLLHALVHLQAQGRIHSSPTSDFNWTTMDVDLRVYERPLMFKDNGQLRNELDSISSSVCSILRRWKISTHARQLTDSELIPTMLSSGTVVPTIDSDSRTSAESKVFKIDLLSLTPDEIKIFSMDLIAFKQRLISWRRAFEQLEIAGARDNDAEFNVPLAILKIQHHVLFIILSTVFETGETCYDAFTPQFQEILSLAERILETQAYQNFSFFFSYSPLLQNLFFTAMKCRVPSLRRRIPRLLSLCPQREGFWHRDSLLRVVQWKLAHEGGKVDWLPPETQRIHSERTEKVTVNGESRLCWKYKRGEQEQSEVWHVEDNVEILFNMGDML